jgi:two-component sensor histidine kinase
MPGVISSLLFLQSGYVQDAKTREMFKESQNRVRSMALIHEKLYLSKSLEGVNFTEYIEDLTRNLITFHGAPASQVDLRVAEAEITLGMDTAVPCGLIINELVSNSLKHAFTPGKPGEICIEIIPSERPPAADTRSEGGTWFRLTVSDNGKGFPEDLDFRATESLGLQIVRSLTDQLDGTIELDRQRGTRFTIFFKEM